MRDTQDFVDWLTNQSVLLDYGSNTGRETPHDAYQRFQKEQKPPETYYFTFGCNTRNTNKYVIIHGSRDATRTKMFELFGSQWAFQYPSAETAGVAQWGLTLLGEWDAEET